MTMNMAIRQAPGWRKSAYSLMGKAGLRLGYRPTLAIDPPRGARQAGWLLCGCPCCRRCGAPAPASRSEMDVEMHREDVRGAGALQPAWLPGNPSGWARRAGYSRRSAKSIRSKLNVMAGSIAIDQHPFERHWRPVLTTLTN